MSYWKKILQQLDWIRGRFVCLEIESEADRNEALAVLDLVRRQELRRVHGSSVLQSAAFVDTDVRDVLLAVRDTKTQRIVGVARNTLAHQIAHVQASRDEYLLDRFPDALLPRIGIATRLAVLPDYRGTVAALSLMDFMFAEGLRRGYAGCVLTCEPGLYTMYLRVGFRPYGPVHPSPSGGFRIPMILLCDDAEHLAATGSPLARTRARHPVHPNPVGPAWLAQMQAEFGAIGFGIAPWEDSDADAPPHHALSAGLSDAGIRELLDNAMALDCQAGQIVVKEDDGGRGVGVVLQGLVEVRRGDRTLAMLGEGELFGELGLILDAPRTASIVATTSETRVLLLSKNALSRVTQPADRARLWQNLATQVARRLVAANQRT